MNEKTTTAMLNETIDTAFPKAMTVFCNNFDDAHRGWDICPVPGKMIRMMLDMDNPKHLTIVSVVTPQPYSQSITKMIFSGNIPSLNDGQPDYPFIAKLLENWEKIG